MKKTLLYRKRDLTPHSGEEDPAKKSRPETEPENKLDHSGLRQTIADPRKASPGSILAVQQTYGNRAVQRLVARSRSQPTSGQAGVDVIQRVVDERVNAVLNENGGSRETNALIYRYMDLIPTARQKDLIHLWSKIGQGVTSKRDQVDTQLRVLRYALLVEATVNGIDSGFALKRRAEKQCTNLGGTWNYKRLVAFNNGLNLNIQEEDAQIAEETYQKAIAALGEEVDSIKQKNNERIKAINQIVPGVEF